MERSGSLRSVAGMEIVAVVTRMIAPKGAASCRRSPHTTYAEAEVCTMVWRSTRTARNRRKAVLNQNIVCDVSAVAWFALRVMRQVIFFLFFFENKR